jgi:hypothetical protein
MKRIILMQAAVFVKYTCTMHPEVISDTPGVCPKSGMTMVIKEMNSKADMQHMQMDSVKNICLKN